MFAERDWFGCVRHGREVVNTRNREVDGQEAMGVGLASTEKSLLVFTVSRFINSKFQVGLTCNNNCSDTDMTV